MIHCSYFSLSKTIVDGFVIGSYVPICSMIFPSLGDFEDIVLFFESIGSTFEQALKALNNENWGCDYKYYWSAPHCCQVGVSVNGVDKSFEYSIDEPVEDIRKRIGDDLFNYFNFTDICTEHPYINNPN